MLCFHRDDIPGLALRMLEALCLSEMHLSSQLCDIKMHNLTHCAEAILALGEVRSFDFLSVCWMDGEEALVEQTLYFQPIVCVVFKSIFHCHSWISFWGLYLGEGCMLHHEGRS